MLASQGSGHTATDPDLERRHASEPGLCTHSHRGGVRWTDGRPPPTSRMLAQLRELVGEQAGAAAANVTADTSQRYGLSDAQHTQLLRIVERRNMSPSDQCREVISLLQ